MIGNKRELARALGASTNTLDKWLEKYGDDVPCLARGRNGKSWQFDIAATVAWFRTKREEERQRQTDRDEQLAQLALPFLDTPATAATPGVVSLKDQLLALEVAKKKREEAERLGQLLLATEVRELLAAAYARLNRTLTLLAEQLATTHNLPPHMTRSIEATIQEAQRAFVRDTQAILRDDDDDDADRAAA